MGSLSERLKAVTDDLQELEHLVVSGDSTPRILSEFRPAVDSIRQTSWAVQQWSELQRQHRDPYTVLGILSKERVPSGHADCQGFETRSGVTGTRLANRGISGPL
jgi:hypothetical protein